MSDPYSAIPSTGKLKLKGVKNSKIDKKKKKKSSPKIGGEDGAEEFQDKSVMLRKLEDEDEQIGKGENQDTNLVDGKRVGPGAGTEDEDVSERIKTDAEKRFDEHRRKRLNERLKREGVKTHKQRVEELNRYLSGLRLLRQRKNSRIRHTPAMVICLSTAAGFASQSSAANFATRIGPRLDEKLRNVFLPKRHWSFEENPITGVGQGMEGQGMQRSSEHIISE